MKILVQHAGQQLGPFTDAEAQAALSAGTISLSDLAWREGSPDWMPLSQVLSAPSVPPPGLSGARSNAPASGLSITSLVLGILSVTLCGCLSGLPAVICGHIARGKIKQSGGTIGGGGFALAGLILGYLSMLITVIAVAVAIPAVQAAKDQAEVAITMNNLRSVGSALQVYAADNNDALPPSLQSLVPQYITDADLLKDSRLPGEEVAYEYFGAGKKLGELPPDGVLAQGKATQGSKRLILHNDMSVANENPALHQH